MGFMKLLEATVKTVVVLPVAAVKDVVTLGGALTDEESAIKKTARSINRDIDSIGDD